MAISWWASPAKINLFLHITGRYPNGYHALQTVFQLLDFGDEIGLAINKTGEINLHDPIAGVAHENNLIVRAARQLQQVSNCKLGADIYLRKQLPMGGGVGGGSSNAATTLLVLNKLWQAQADINTLLTLGQQLGADVPVFINGKTTFAEGTGNVFTPLSVPNMWYLVVHPGEHVSTPAIFTADSLPRNTAPITPNQYTFEKTHNDCQQIVCDRHPEVAKLLHWLLNYAPSRMTGTGACVFAVFSTQNEANRVYDLLPQGWTGFVARGVGSSPLLKQLQHPDNVGNN